MDITCVADLHGFFPELPGGDLLIVAGDLTAKDQEHEYRDFTSWLSKQPYQKKIFIGGNHDNHLVGKPFITFSECEYLCDSGTEFEGLKIWGSPWTKRFKGMNPRCMAFTVETEEELAEKWKLIPDDTDILVTHSPPKDVLDGAKNYVNGKIESVGSFSLLMKATSLSRLKLLVFGHVHEAYGVLDTRRANNELKESFPNPLCKSFPIIVNASHVNEHYEPVNKSIRIEL